MRGRSGHAPHQFRAMARFRDIKTLRIFASTHASIFNLSTKTVISTLVKPSIRTSVALAKWRQQAA